MPSLSAYPLGKVILSAAIVAVAMLLVDVIWLRLRGSMYKAAVAAVQGAPLRVRLVPGAAAYALMAASIPLIAFPAARTASPGSAAVSGAMLGAAVYGVFNATNAAIFSSYPASMAVQDTVWGTALFAAASALFASLLGAL